MLIYMYQQHSYEFKRFQQYALNFSMYNMEVNFTAHENIIEESTLTYLLKRYVYALLIYINLIMFTLRNADDKYLYMHI